MAEDESLAVCGLSRLWERTRGDRRIRVAVVDGSVDADHAAFAGGSLTSLAGIWPQGDFGDLSAVHGTMVASVLFGQHGGPVPGVAPGCTGISVPVFTNTRTKVSQVELARALEYAVSAGAHVVNVSGGQLSSSGGAGTLLDTAVRRCRESNVLVVAATGNDGRPGIHVPASLPSVLAVGALGNTGCPMACSNWDTAYRQHGITAPGEDILCALPGGGTGRRSGTSLAAPIVAGSAALLLSMQVQSGRRPDPLGVGAVLLASADPCPQPHSALCVRYLAGSLNLERAVEAMADDQLHLPDATDDTERASPSCRCWDDSSGAGQAGPARDVGTGSVSLAAAIPPVSATCSRSAEAAGFPDMPSDIPWTPLVYAIGTLGYDFGTEARRDAFRQVMDAPPGDGHVAHANPYDVRRMVDHLLASPSEASALMWVLSLEMTPVYAIEPVGAYAADVHSRFVRLLAAGAADADDHIERIALPGRLSGRTVRLFSGQTVPVVEVEHPRGLCGWEVNRLAEAAIQSAAAQSATADTATIRTSLREFLTRVYFDLRNLGATSRDRALNFAATNAFQITQSLSGALAAGMALDSIHVEKSPFGRQDSDCWDIKLRFFDPENSRRAKRVYRFTVDVSDVLPVSVGEVRAWPES
ncbi:PatA/PatG family cyanobactin maturation protease [Streptomyces sp. NPDC003006]